jgi:hypothetical protein
MVKVKNINGNEYEKKEITDSTKTKYKQATDRLEKAGLTLTDAEAVLKHLDDLAIGASSYRTYLSAIRYKMGEDIPEAYLKKMREMAGNVKVATDSQQLSDKQKIQYVPHKDLVKIANELPMGVNKVLASLYTLTPPLRNNFGDMRVVNRINSKIPGNLLVMTKKKATFVMRNYKTSSSFGDVRIPLTQKAFALVRDWFKHLGGQPEFLLGKQMSPTIVGTHIEDAFRGTGKKVGVNLLRHAYIKEHLPPIALNINDKKNLADKMLHSVATQNQYYSLNVE